VSRVASRGDHYRADLRNTLILAAVEAVTANGLVKRFEATTAVDELDLVVAAGQVHGLLGANGAGKTTLLRLLFGLIVPDAGSIRLLGRSLGGPGSAALDHVAGFVEEPSFYPYLSGTANLALLARLDGAVPPGLIADALERVGLTERAGSRVGGYSTGMRQRLGIAAALLRAPRLLLLDEPTSGLDPAGARAVATLVRELADQGVAVLLSSHQIGELEKVCDAYTVIRKGRVVWDGTAAQLSAQAPASAYLLVTSDDDRALQIASGIADVRAGRSPRGQLTIAVQEGSLDRLVLALGDARVAVRRLELLVSPLESMFFALSGDEKPDELEPHDLAERVFAGARSDA
jgi:ABC-2 type transport system ATP-binding protein